MHPVALGMLLLHTLAVAPASAGVPSVPSNPSVKTEINEDGFEGGVEAPGGGSGGDGRGIRSGPPSDCAWARYRLVSNSGDTQGIGRFLESQGAEEVNIDGHVFRADGDQTLYYFTGADCGNGHAWVRTNIDPRDLLPGLGDHFTAVLSEPVPNISPPAEFGTLVNLGTWIAVDDPGVVTVTARDGPVWAQGTGTHTRITIDFGNGDTEVCEGLGTPIVDTNVREEGPCGYTFVRTNRPDTSFPVTLTSTYTVTYRLSNGQSGVLGTVDRAIEFDYPVKQVQAVGTG